MTPPAPGGAVVRIDPGRVRVVATVLSVDTARTTLSPEEPCAKAPCTARVRIDSVLGYGAGFLSPLAAGQSLSVSFVYTLAPTGDLFPALRPALPGLAPGDQFRADLEEAADAVGGAVPGPTLSVLIYQKKSSK